MNAITKFYSTKLTFNMFDNVVCLASNEIINCLRRYTFFYLLSCGFLINPGFSANWVQVEVGHDSGNTYLWPYFYTASRFIDTDSIEKKQGFVIYVELINAIKAHSSNVTSLIVRKKSNCDGEKVVWQSFIIYKSEMGRGKPIMQLYPNETEILEQNSSGALSDAFVCNFK